MGCEVGVLWFVGIPSKWLSNGSSYRILAGVLGSSGVGVIQVSCPFLGYVSRWFGGVFHSRAAVLCGFCFGWLPRLLLGSLALYLGWGILLVVLFIVCRLGFGSFLWGS